MDGGEEFQRLTRIARSAEGRSMRMRGRMSTKEFMVKCHGPAVTEFELLRAEIWKTGRRSVLAAQSTGIQVQGEAPHFSRAAEERAPAHRRQLF